MRTMTITLGLGLNACYATVQPHLAESTEVLAPHAASVTVAGGVGVLGDNCCRNVAAQYVGGLEARVRVGVGAHQEVGVSLLAGAGSPVGNGDPPFAGGGTLSYKIAPVRWLAFIASAGAVDMSSASVVVFSRRSGGNCSAVHRRERHSGLHGRPSIVRRAGLTWRVCNQRIAVHAGRRRDSHE